MPRKPVKDLMDLVEREITKVLRDPKGLRSDKPAEDMAFLKPKGGDVFRRVRDDSSEAEEFQFKRDASGKVTSFIHFSNPTVRISEQ